MDIFRFGTMLLLLFCAAFLTYRVWQFLVIKIPSPKTQSEEGTKILQRGKNFVTAEEKEEILEDFEDYFLGIKVMIIETIFEYALLNIVIFFLLQTVFGYIPTPPPGPYVVAKWVVSLVVTGLATSFGWFVILVMNERASAVLKEDLLDLYIVLGVFEPDN